MSSVNKASPIEIIPTLTQIVISAFANIVYKDNADKEILLKEIKDQLELIKKSFISIEPDNLNRPYINEERSCAIHSWKDYYLDVVKDYFKSTFGNSINLTLEILPASFDNNQSNVLRIEIYYDHIGVRRLYDVAVDLNEIKTYARMQTIYFLFNGFPSNVSICDSVNLIEEKDATVRVSDTLRDEIITSVKTYIDSICLTNEVD